MATVKLGENNHLFMYTLFLVYILSFDLSTILGGGQGRYSEWGNDLGQFRLVLLGPRAELRQGPWSSFHTLWCLREFCVFAATYNQPQICVYSRQIRNWAGPGSHLDFFLKLCSASYDSPAFHGRGDSFIQFLTSGPDPQVSLSEPGREIVTG